jgi:probable HAF family extracellular repeat protein
MRNAIRLIALTIIAVLKAKLTLVVFCLLLGVSAWAQRLQDGEKRSTEVFTITDIGPNVRPVGVNYYGQVAVTVGPGGFVGAAGIWSKRDGLKILGTLPGGVNSFATGINNHGDIIGYTDDIFATLWWSTGVVENLNALISPSFVDNNVIPYAINDSRTVTGWMGFEEPFVWSPINPAIANRPIDLNALPEGRGAGVAIDAFGNVALSANGEVFVWDPAGVLHFVNLQKPLSSYQSASGISYGYVSGQTCDTNQICAAFIWNQKHGAQFLGHLAGQTSSVSNGINRYRQVVGYSGTHAFLWTHSSGMHDLNALIKAQSWQLVSATGINDKTQIVGSGLLNGVEHGFLLTVVPRKQ